MKTSKRILVGFPLLLAVVIALGLLVYSPMSNAKKKVDLGWSPDPLVTDSIAPGETATYSVVLKNLGKSSIAPTNQLQVIAEGDIAPYLTIEQPVFPKGTFQSGKEVSFDVTVSEDAPVGVSEGTILLTRVLPNGKVKEVWRAEALAVSVEVAESTTNNLSLVGVDPYTALPGQAVDVQFEGGDSALPVTISLAGIEVSAGWVSSGDADAPNVAEFTVPEGAESGPLFLTQEDLSSNAVWFNVSDISVIDPMPDEIVLDQYGVPTAVNQLLVSLVPEQATPLEAQRLAALVNAEIVGRIPMANAYQLRVPSVSLGELRAAAAQLRADPAVWAVLENKPLEPLVVDWSSDMDWPFQRDSNRVEEGAAAYFRASEDGKIDPSNGPVTIAVSELGVAYALSDFDGYTESGTANNNIAILAADLPIISIDRCEGEQHGSTVVGITAANIGDGLVPGGSNAGLLSGLGQAHGGFRIHVTGVTGPVSGVTTGGGWAAKRLYGAQMQLLAGASVLNWSFGIHPDGARRSTCAQLEVDVDCARRDHVHGSSYFVDAKRVFDAFLSNMEVYYPNAVAVAAAANSDTSMDSALWGIDSPSLIVVGAHDYAYFVDGLGIQKDPERASAPGIGTYPNFGHRVDIAAAAPVRTSLDDHGHGTSFAAPLVAATVAAMQSINPDLTAVEIRHLLRKYALPIEIENNTVTLDPTCWAGRTEDVVTAPLTADNGEVRSDGTCYADPSLVCEGRGARLNVEGAIRALLAPSFISIPVTNVEQGSDYSYAITATDLNTGDTLTITGTDLPAWLTLTDNGDGTATLAGTPGAGDAGDHSVSLEVSDGALQGTQEFTITVTPQPSNGQCGSTAGGACATSLNSGSPDLCSVGSIEGFSLIADEWSWMCTGVNGGTSANCSKDRCSQPQPSTKFTIGDAVEVDTGDGSPLNVRATPNGTLVGTQSPGVQGAVVAGPSYADGLWWWLVDFDSGPDGWVAEDFLREVTGARTLIADIEFADENLAQCVQEHAADNGWVYADEVTWLECYSRNIADITPLGEFRGLWHLNLQYNQITHISALAGLSGLTGLYLSYNQIADISALAGLTGLGGLGLDGNQIADISALAGLTGLESLGLSHNPITDFSPLAGLIGLEWLALNNNQITDISALSGLTGLEWLDLRGNNGIPCAQLDALEATLPTTTVLRPDCNAPPAIPANPTPGSTSSPGPTTSSSTVTLSWSASSGATYYDLGVRDLATNTLVVDTQISGTSYTVTLSAGRQYRWNVAACSTSGCSGFTTPRYFQTPGSVPIDGQCGSRAGGACSTSLSSSSSGLCSIGDVSTFLTTSDKWGWFCTGQDGGANAVCTEDRCVEPEPVDGQCGPVAGGVCQSYVDENTNGLCSVGSVSNITDAAPGYWYWRCNGEDGGNDPICNVERCLVPQ